MITLTITTRGGTTLTLNIPEDSPDLPAAQNQPSSAPSAVVTPEPQAMASECGKLSEIEGNEIQVEDKVVDVLDEVDVQKPHLEGVEGGDIGEEGIGSVREKEGGAGEEEGEYDLADSTSSQVGLSDINEHNLCEFAFPTFSGKSYRIPKIFAKILFDRWGVEETIDACKDAYIWLISNPTRYKTEKGMGKFISGWLKRNSEKAPPTYPGNVPYARPIEEKKGLLSAPRNTVTSW